MKNEGNAQRKSMIKIRNGYSHTAGITHFSVDYQLEEFDDRTRRLLSNLLYEVLERTFNEKVALYKYGETCPDNGRNEFCKDILSEVFLQRTNLKHGSHYILEKVYERINEVIESAPYNEVLDILWYIVDWLYAYMELFSVDLYSIFNDFFEQEFVGYRFVEKRIIAITDKNEIASIENTCNSKYDGINSHMQKAVGFLADRDNKDYKNSIKESISAVESVCQIIAGNSKATLGQALKVIKAKGMDMHPALEKAISSLYGYTSDQGGIRHCEGMFESNVSFEEAKFMLVSCSAFINFLIAENEKEV